MEKALHALAPQHVRESHPHEPHDQVLPLDQQDSHDTPSQADFVTKNIFAQVLQSKTIAIIYTTTTIYFGKSCHIYKHNDIVWEVLSYTQYKKLKFNQIANVIQFSANPIITFLHLK